MRTTKSLRGQRGATLLPSLLICTLMMATSAALTSNALQRHAAEEARAEEELACHVAESGLDVGLYEVQTGKDLGTDGIGVAAGSISGGSYTTSIAPAFVGNGTYTLTSTGTAGSRRRRMQLVVTSTTSATYGMIGLNSLSVSGAAKVDSYDSKAGTYASQVKNGHAGNQGNVGSNGNITASGSGAIYGNATPGPGSTYSGNFTVTGSTAPATTQFKVSSYSYSPPGKASKSYSGTSTLKAGTYQYKSLSMTAKDTLTINGDVTLYIDGSISMAGQSQIVVASGAKLTIHQGDASLSLAGGGVVNQTALPANVQIFSASTSTVTVTGNSAFYGAVFSPYAAFNRNGTADYYGSIVAKTVSLVGNGWMHYDTSLGGTGSATFTVAMERGW